MTKILTGIAALMIVGAAALPLPASAAEQGLTRVQSTELSSQYRWHRRYVRPHWGYRHWGYRHWGPRYYGYRHYWGPRYRYGYRYPYWRRHYGYYGYPYRYYHRPGLAVGVRPLGFGGF